MTKPSPPADRPGGAGRENGGCHVTSFRQGSRGDHRRGPRGIRCDHRRGTDDGRRPAKLVTAGDAKLAGAAGRACRGVVPVTDGMHRGRRLLQRRRGPGKPWPRHGAAATGPSRRRRTRRARVPACCSGCPVRRPMRAWRSDTPGLWAGIRSSHWPSRGTAHPGRSRRPRVPVRSPRNCRRYRAPRRPPAWPWVSPATASACCR